VLTPAGSLADLWTTRSGNRLNTTRVENRTTQFAVTYRIQPAVTGLLWQRLLWASNWKLLSRG